MIRNPLWFSSLSILVGSVFLLSSHASAGVWPALSCSSVFVGSGPTLSWISFPWVTPQGLRSSPAGPTMAQEGWGSFIVPGDAWSCWGASVLGVLPAGHPCREFPSSHSWWGSSPFSCLRLPRRTRTSSATYWILHGHGARHDSLPWTRALRVPHYLPPPSVSPTWRLPGPWPSKLWVSLDDATPLRAFH